MAADPIELLVDHACRVDFADLPAVAVEAAQRGLIDTVGAAIVGLDNPLAVITRQMVTEAAGRMEATVWGGGLAVPASAAAFTNTIAGRCRELDDVHEGSPLIGIGHGGHVSVMVVPAVLAVAQSLPRPVSGQEVLTAIAVGSDIIPRLRMAAGRSGRLGWEAPTVAPFGIAAAVGRLYGLSRSAMANAMGAAYAQCAGNVQGTEDGAWDVWLSAGLAARAGVTAADLARRGHHGTGAPLLGRAGLYPLYFRGEYHPEALTTGLGRGFEGANLTCKIYSSCKYTHSAISAVIELARRHGLTPGDIERIEVGTNQDELRVVGLDAAGQPKRRPESVGAAQFSLPFVLALALVKGGVFLDTLTSETLDDPVVLDLADRVVLTLAEDKTAQLANQGYPADDVAIRTRDGQVFSQPASQPQGHPANPLSFDQVVAKFERCCDLAATPPSRRARDRFIQAVADLPTSPDTRRLVADLWEDTEPSARPPVGGTAFVGGSLAAGRLTPRPIDDVA